MKTTIRTGAALGVGSTLARPLEAASTRRPTWFDISLAEWSLHRMLFGGQLTNLEFPEFAKREFDIHAVEYVNQFFKDKATDWRYLHELKARAEDAGVRSVLIMCDGEGRLGDPDEAARKQAVENHYKWVVAAKFLGCHSIRVNAASEGSYEEQMALASDGLRKLSEFGSLYDMNVIVENHGGLSSNGNWLAGTIRRVGLPNCGTLPDFGNFRIEGDQWYDRYEGVRELMPFARGVSAKSHEFDANGNEVRTDYRQMLKIVHDAGYRGYIGVEWEGNSPGEIEGTRLTKQLLDRVGSEPMPVLCSASGPQPRKQPHFGSKHGCGDLRGGRGRGR